ncbi:MAG: hypothetical protein QOK48_3410 [Blastocatellia bacterium]|jgi:hypothetical protein|nr:hypothetical protein [Blastocatellia bacterium]
MSSANLKPSQSIDRLDQFGNRLSTIGGRDAVLRPTPVQIERELEVLSQIMDNQFRIPVLGWRFGMNAIIDLVPQVGDVATTLVALYVLISAVRYRVPKVTLLRMGLNIAIYFLVGLLPFIGDLFGAWWKPNIRNINLLRRRATVSAADAKQGRTSDWLFVALIAGSLVALLFGSIAFMLFLFWYVATHLQLTV